jgi:hypothetical protein
MTDSEGTYARLVEIAEKKGKPQQPPAPPASEKSLPIEQPREDLTTTPYISQNYRFTDDELRWLRRQSYNLTERIGTKVSQNTILRVALRLLRDAFTKNPKRNPLVDAVSQLKK